MSDDSRSVGEWLLTIRDGWPALAVAIALGCLAGLIAAAFQPTRYAARGVVVVTPAVGFLDPSDADPLPTLADAVLRIAETNDVLRRVGSAYAAAARDPATAARRREVADPEWLRARVSVRHPPDSDVLELRGEGITQRDAIDVTRALVSALEASVNGASLSRDAGIRLRTFTLGEPRGRTSPTLARNMLLGANAGVVVGVALAVLLGIRRRRLRRPEDLASALGAPLVGCVEVAPGVRTAGVERAAVGVRAALRLDTPQVVIVTGPARDDMIGVVTHAIGVALQEMGLRTLLIDADPQGHWATSAAGLGPQDGSDMLFNGHPGDIGDVPEWDDQYAAEGGAPAGLQVIPAGGDPTATVSRAFAQPTFRRSLETLKERRNLVLVSAPTTARRADVFPPLMFADQVLCIAESGTRAVDAARSRDVVAHAGQKFTGVIVVRGRRQ